MEILTWLIVVSFLVYIAYKDNQTRLENTEKIRELSIALKSQWLKEYVEAIPEPVNGKVELIEDELVEIWDIDPAMLLRSLSK